MSGAENTLAAYAALFERFAPETLSGLADLVREDVRFRDPFHDVVGREAMTAVLATMFDVFESPRFTVSDRAMGARHGFLLWRFDGVTRRGERVAFDGTSTLRFDEEGLVAVHDDHWDAAGAVHARVPLVGLGVRLVNARIAALAGRRKA